MIYTIQINQVVAIEKTVEAKDEGEALEKARDLANESDLNEYEFVRELESHIIRQQ